MYIRMTVGMSIVHVRASVCEYVHVEAVMTGRAHVSPCRHMSLWDLKSVQSEVAGERGLCCRDECTGTDWLASDSRRRPLLAMGKVYPCKTIGPWA